MNLGNTVAGVKDFLLIAGTLLVMGIGVLGVILPIIPGLPLVWGAAFVYGHFTHYQVITHDYLLHFGLASAALIILEYLFKAYGAQKMGASKWGMFGAFVGMVAGIIVGTLPAIILGPLVGAMLFEMMLGKRLLESLRAGCGTFIGFMIGTILQLALAVVMVGVFLSKVVLK